jgi:outer membrane protein assembly factor BamA
MNGRAIVWYTIFLFFSLIIFNIQSEQDLSLYTVVYENGTIYQNKIRALVGESFLLHELKVAVDFPLFRQEILYLTDWIERSVHSYQQIVHGIQLLAKKEQIAEIALSIKPLTEGYCVALLIKGHFLISRIKITGIVRQVEEYRQLYPLDRCDIFAHAKHKQGVQNIRQHLQEIGYCASTVLDTLQFDDVKKEVAVTLQISCGPQYRVSKVDFDIASSVLSQDEEVVQIISEKCQALIQHRYSDSVLRQLENDLCTSLLRCGYPFVAVLCTNKMDHELREITVHTVIRQSKLGKQILLIGNKSFLPQSILEAVQLFFKSRSSVSEQLVIEAVEDFYKKHGFFGLKIQLDASEKKYCITIDEGKRGMVDEIVFYSLSAASYVEKPELEQFCSTRLCSRMIDDEKTASVVESLVPMLHARGFVGSSVERYTYQQKEDNKYRLVIVLDEDQQVFVSNIRVVIEDDGAKQFNFDQFIHKHRFPLLITPLFLEQGLEQLRSYVHSEGYKHAQIRVQLEGGEEKNLCFYITLGKAYQSRKVIFLGRANLPFASLLARYKPEIITENDSQITRLAVEDLQKLSIFQEVQLYPGAPIDETQLFYLRLVPDDPYEVRVRMGAELQQILDYQTFGGFSYKLGGSFFIKNLLHRGELFRIDADLGRSHEDLICSWTLPIFIVPSALFSRLWFYKLQGYHIVYDAPGTIGYNKNIYQVRRDGILWALYTADMPLNVGISSGFEWQETKSIHNENAQALALAIDFDAALLGKHIPYFFVDCNSVISILDDQNLPHRGIFTVFSFKWMLPLTNVHSHFLKLQYEQAFFIPIGPIITGEVRVRVGYMFHRTLRTISPLERFYLGGSHSIRGYEADMFPPLSPFVDDEGNETLVPRGGKFFVSGNFELRCKLFRRTNGAIFHDMGVLSDDIDLSVPLLHTSGLGLRFETPVGPLRFDIGWKWKKGKIEPRDYAWYLSFGRSF